MIAFNLQRASTQDPKLAIRVLPELTDHYPELLGNVYVAPVNSIFFTVWRVVKLFIRPQTAAKFVLIRGKNWREQLAAEVGRDVELPAHMRPTSTGVDATVETVDVVRDQDCTHE